MIILLSRITIVQGESKDLQLRHIAEVLAMGTQRQ